MESDEKNKIDKVLVSLLLVFGEGVICLVWIEKFYCLFFYILCIEMFWEREMVV